MQEISVSRRADATPHAAALIEGLRDIGYSLETAISDVIDNSITAGARRIQIVTETCSDDPMIAIVDDGQGMTDIELVAAMRPGSRNPLAARDAPDLGRFGLGLKRASFSQCRRMTVVSRKFGKTSAAIWDLDDVAERNIWEVQLPPDVLGIPAIDQLGSAGTLVLWQKLDRLTGSFSHNVGKRAEVINQRIAETERHLRLVFHRFMEDRPPLFIMLNGRVLRPLDPFAQKYSTTISDPEEKLSLAHGDMEIQSFTLPHHTQMSKADWEDVAGAAAPDHPLIYLAATPAGGLALVVASSRAPAGSSIHPIWLDGLPELLVELGTLPGPGGAAACLSLDRRQPRRGDGGTAGHAGRPVQALSLPSDHELRQDLPQGPEPGQGDCRNQENDGGAPDLNDGIEAVSYTHLTLPTSYSV